MGRSMDMDGTWTFDRLAQLKPKQLNALMSQGVAPDMDGLVGWSFRGWNVLEPIAKPVMKTLGFMRFAKGFYQLKDAPKPSEGGQLLGFNFKIAPGGLEDPWSAEPNEEDPKRHGFYVVHPVGAGNRKEKGAPEDSLFLDYHEREEHNRLFDGGALYGEGGIRDYLVQIDPENPDLLIGKAYYKVPPLTVTGGFFVLERLKQHDFHTP